MNNNPLYNFYSLTFLPRTELRTEEMLFVVNTDGKGLQTHALVLKN